VVCLLLFTDSSSACAAAAATGVSAPAPALAEAAAAAAAASASGEYLNDFAPRSLSSLPSANSSSSQWKWRLSSGGNSATAASMDDGVAIEWVEGRDEGEERATECAV
jgi:hypothetical protein